MDQKTIRALEFHKILDSVASYASAEPSRAAIRELSPIQNIKEIEERLNEVEEADKVLYQHAVNISFGFEDISRILEKASVMSVLTMGELLKVALTLRVARNLRYNILKVPDDTVNLLKYIAAAIYTDKTLEEDIDSSIISETEMNDNASPELREVRQKIKRTGENIKARLYSYVNSSSYSKYIQDNIVTIRGDRYVIPVKAEFRGAIPGLIHDQSASGQTIYVEPMVIVEMNNTLKTYVMEEEAEIERILRRFTQRISVAVGELSAAFGHIIRLDIIFAKARHAHEIRAVKPQMNNKGYLSVSRGRHPLIAADRVIPTDIYLGKDFDMLFITGPNTGGKTVALKLVGLFELMAMSGLYVPAREAELTVFDEIFCDIGDEQSIEQNLSTFSSHIANIVRITERLNANTLVLLDELGAGTDPTEGASLAVSIASYIKESGAKAVITTHYNELKEYAVVTGRAENASMDFDPVTFNPTYRLIIGTPGASNAILIAKKLGLNASIIEQAQSGIQAGKMQFENVLQSLETARRKAQENEEKTRELLMQAEESSLNAKKERDRLFAQREKLNENVRKETKRLVEEAMAEANEIVDALRALIDNPTEENLFEARKLRKSLTRFVVNEENEFTGFGEEADGEIREGDTVLVKTLKVEGIVDEIHHAKGTAIVKLGKLKSSFKLEDLLKLKSKEKPKEILKAPVRDLRSESFNTELNLIGKNTMEALFELDSYIDRALLTSVSEIRIIHGHGTGKLREAVQRRLREHKSIKEFRDGGYDEGGRGATIVTLKR